MWDWLLAGCSTCRSMRVRQSRFLTWELRPLRPTTCLSRRHFLPVITPRASVNGNVALVLRMVYGLQADNVGGTEVIAIITDPALDQVMLECP